MMNSTTIEDYFMFTTISLQKKTEIKSEKNDRFFSFHFISFIIYFV